jgi:sigma-B regulation protein RsbU (phosphoserine phosphatase)
LKILIAEDDSSSRMILKAMLQRAGHEVYAMENGRMAWDSWRLEFCPLVIMDWDMPELDGPELCRLIRSRGDDRYAYIIILTARGGKANYLEAMEAGADDFLTKPADDDELLARLHVANRILGLRRHMKQLEGLLPVCAWCKKIRDERGRWEEMETYISRFHSDASFTHGSCPSCASNFLRQAGLRP